MEFKNIIFEIRESVAYITLNNPERRNPISFYMARELKESFDLCDYDDNVRAVVIRGAGGNFSAGGDINVMKARIDAGERGTRAVCRQLGETLFRLRNLKKPTIAWVEGAVAGAGIALSMSCDFSLISESSKCVFAFINLGLVPDSGAVCLVTKAVGSIRATDLFMSGRVFTGREGADWGMFTEAVPMDELENTVKRYIKKFANGPTQAYANIKTLINQAQYANFMMSVQNELDCQGMCECTEDFKEAVNAFLDKRKPEFKGY